MTPSLTFACVSLVVAVLFAVASLYMQLRSMKTMSNMDLDLTSDVNRFYNSFFVVAILGLVAGLGFLGFVVGLLLHLFG